ncbi:MAG: hypothetical protein M0D55_15570 [Elusimicrobiota bacterium]|nr:MAG: hypothetical protein M0D55_15570 [Elusimicrobiota bacterium]
MTWAIDINFAAKTLGGGSSSISLTSPASVSGSFTTQSYASLTGDAVLDYGGAGAISSANGNWTGTTIKLLTSGGQTAGAASLDVRVFNTSVGSNPTYGGVTAGPLQ